LSILDDIDPQAKRIGAVNTILVNTDGNWSGFNTDYLGFLKPILRFTESIHSCLIIGAGGAARAVAFGAIEQFNLSALTILNRTEQNAENLILDLQKYKVLDYKYGTLESGTAQKYDLIVNTTSVGMTGFTASSPIRLQGKVHDRSIVYDIIYKPRQTIFLQEAQQMGLKTFNGWPMLIYQAEAAYKIWTGKRYGSELLNALLNNY